MYWPHAKILELKGLSHLNPRRHRGIDAPPPPAVFWNIFFVNRSIVTIFPIAFRPSFLRPS